MKTYLDCIPCFFKQCLQVSRATKCSVILQKEILDEVSELIPGFSLNHTPPEMAGAILNIIREKTGQEDPYDDIKEISRNRVRNVLPKVEDMVKQSEAPLLTAVKLTIAANIIDYGANGELDLGSELISLLMVEDSKIKKEREELFNFNSFSNKLMNSHNILYIGDNVGEHFFDRILIEEMKRANPKISVTYATRDRPVLNDITLSDAIDAGIDKHAKAISSGSQLPGTVLNLCNKEFTDIFNSADMIISKGQGNYETLSDVSAPIFFLLMAKCPVIAEHACCDLKDILLIECQDSTLSQ